MSAWGVIPTLRVADMGRALDFYLGPLEFELDRGGPGEANSSVTRGGARLMLETAGDHYGEAYNAAIRRRLGSPSPNALYIEADGLPAFHERLVGSGVRVVDPLAERPWGQVEFTVEDPDANWLTFWSADGSAAAGSATDETTS